MCLQMVHTLSRKEGSDWGWATFGSAIDEQKARNDRESATNAGTRSATDAKDLLPRNWALSRTRRRTSYAMIWVRGDLLPTCAAQAQRRLESKTDGNFWRLHFHVWPGSISSGKHRYGIWDLVLQVRSGIKTAIDGVVFTDFFRTRKECSAEMQG